MIRQTLRETKAATFAILECDVGRQDLPIPIGSGFFVSPDGLFLTCRHVTQSRRLEDLLISQDLGPGSIGFASFGHQPTLVEEWPLVDLALLRFDVAGTPPLIMNHGSGYPALRADLKVAEDGTPVYAYGYPLSTATEPIEQVSNAGMMYGSHVSLTPRATSAIISSRVEQTRPPGRDQGPEVYVLDRTFNKGNSGGPVVLQESGKVIGVVARRIDARYEQDSTSARSVVRMPSQFGVAVSLANIASDLSRLGLG